MLQKIILITLAIMPFTGKSQVSDSATRKVPMQGTTNFRDAGGYSTTDGKMVVNNKVFRSADISKLTDADMQIMKDKKIYTVIDFRGIKEAEMAPDKQLPNTDYTLCNAGSDSMPDMKNMAIQIRKGGFLKTMYGNESLKYYGPRYKPFFQKLLYLPDSSSLLFHCTGGRDRTGMANALFLYTLGVPQSTIEADFVASNVYLETMHNSMFQKIAEGFGLTIEKVKEEMELTPELIRSFFLSINNQYGSMEIFLKDELGIGPKEISLLRKKYTVSVK